MGDEYVLTPPAIWVRRQRKALEAGEDAGFDNGIGKFMAPTRLLPPTPTHSAWVAYAIIFPVLLLVLVTSPIWMGTFGPLKLINALKRACRDRSLQSRHAQANTQVNQERRDLADLCLSSSSASHIDRQCDSENGEDDRRADGRNRLALAQ